MSSFVVRSTADTNPLRVNDASNKARVLELVGYHLTNRAGTARYVKLYDAANVADVTVGTTKPKLEVVLPADSTVSAAQLESMFQLGIVIATTTGIGDSDTGAPSADDVIGTINYGLPGANR